MDFSGATETGGSIGDVFAGTRGPEAFGNTVTGATAMGCWPTCWGNGVKVPSPPRQVRAATRFSSVNLAMTLLSAAPVPLPDLAEVATASSASRRALIALTHPSEARRSFDGAAIALVASAAARASNWMRMDVGFAAASIVQWGCIACHPADGEPGQALATWWPLWQEEEPRSTGVGRLPAVPDADFNGSTLAGIVISCGVLLLNRQCELFVCHATGTSRWDLPKGLREPDESSVGAAVRETWEETGLLLLPAQLQDVGDFAYLPGKRLHLFFLRVDNNAFDLTSCRCRSTFVHPKSGLATPEVDGYAWKPVSDLASWCGKNMTRVLAALDWDAMASRAEAAPLAVDTTEP